MPPPPDNPTRPAPASPGGLFQGRGSPAGSFIPELRFQFFSVGMLLSRHCSLPLATGHEPHRGRKFAFWRFCDSVIRIQAQHLFKASLDAERSDLRSKTSPKHLEETFKVTKTQFQDELARPWLRLRGGITKRRLQAASKPLPKRFEAIQARSLIDKGRQRQPIWNHNWFWLKPIHDSTKNHSIKRGSFLFSLNAHESI